MQASLAGSIYSQTEVVRRHLEQAEVRHDDVVRVTIPNVRVDAEGTLFFCNVPKVDVHEVVALGDQGPLPHTVTIHNVQVPTAGYYDLRNVLVSVNGAIAITVDAQSAVAEAW